MKQCCVGVALLAALLLGSAGAADAHASLKKSVPAAGAAVAAPAEIRLEFDEPVEVRLSQVKVEAEGGQAVAAEALATDPGDKTVVVLKLPLPLKPGDYRVDWRIVSSDTHKLRGSFTFVVRP